MTKTVSCENCKYYKEPEQGMYLGVCTNSKCKFVGFISKEYIEDYCIFARTTGPCGSSGIFHEPRQIKGDKQ